MGIQCLLWAPGYNVFSDLGTIPVILCCLALCVLLKRLCIAGGKWFNIWKIDESIERMQGDDESLDLKFLYNLIDIPRMRHQMGEDNVPFKVKFHAS